MPQSVIAFSGGPHQIFIKHSSGKTMTLEVGAVCKHAWQHIRSVIRTQVTQQTMVVSIDNHSI